MKRLMEEILKLIGLNFKEEHSMNILADIVDYRAIVPAQITLNNKNITNRVVLSVFDKYNKEVVCLDWKDILTLAKEHGYVKLL